MPLPAPIAAHRVALVTLCQQARARRLDAFGSVTRDDFDPSRSDLDFLVAFEDMVPGQYADAYFTLKEGLESIFQRPVDLLTPSALANPYLKRRVESEIIRIYEA